MGWLYCQGATTQNKSKQRNQGFVAHANCTLHMLQSSVSKNDYEFKRVVTTGRVGYYGYE